MKTITTIILSFIITITFAQPKEAYQKITDSLLNKGDYKSLIRFFDNELKKHPESEDVLRWLGYLHIQNNNLDLGEKYYTAALAVNTKCARCYLNIGKAYSLRGDNKKALEYFDKAINTDPKDAALYAGRAKLQEMLGEKFRALRDYDKAIQIDSANAGHYINRGLYNANAGYYSLAISDLSKAIELSPENYYPYFQRSNVYYSQQRLDEALQDINKAIEIDSSEFSLYTGRGAIFDVMKEYKKAIDEYSKAINLNKDEYLPYHNRAGSYYNLENLDASCADYSILKSLIQSGKIKDQSVINEINETSKNICDSSNASYYYQRGIGFYNLKEFNKALDIYARGLVKFPENAMMLSFKANTHLALNDYAKAIEYYNLSLNYKDNILAEIKNNPSFTTASTEKITSFYNGSLATTYFSMAECKINLGLFEEALTNINKAIELAPDVKDFNKEAYYNMRGHIYLIKREIPLAIADFNKSIQVNKDFSLAHVNLAIAKICLAEKVKFSSYNIHGNFRNQPINLNWDISNRSALKKSEATILSALNDCNTAIELDGKLGFAYYIRGQIKQMLMSNDYCLDLLTAKGLGMVVEAELLKNCDK